MDNEQVEEGLPKAGIRVEISPTAEGADFTVVDKTETGNLWIGLLTHCNAIATFGKNTQLRTLKRTRGAVYPQEYVQALAQTIDPDTTIIIWLAQTKERTLSKIIVQSLKKNSV
jgi:hypothetical protein